VAGLLAGTVLALVFMGVQKLRGADAARTAARHYAGEAAHEDLRDPARGRSPE